MGRNPAQTQDLFAQSPFDVRLRHNKRTTESEQKQNNPTNAGKVLFTFRWPPFCITFHVRSKRAVRDWSSRCHKHCGQFIECIPEGNIWECGLLPLTIVYIFLLVTFKSVISQKYSDCSIYSRMIKVTYRFTTLHSKLLVQI